MAGVVDVSRNARCKRCGSDRVMWHQSKRTGKWYLAFATHHHGMVVDGTGSEGWVAHPHQPHRCDDPLVGGFPACPFCKRHHSQPLFHADPQWCEGYPEAPL